MAKQALPKKRGRKPLVPPVEQRKKVRLWTAGGISEEHQAELLGISRNTLRKRFAKDLASGGAIEQAKNLERLAGAADDGNVAAMKHLDARFAAAAAHASWNGDQPPAVKEPTTKDASRASKKEIHKAAAEGAMKASPEWGQDLIPEGASPSTSTRQ